MVKPVRDLSKYEYKNFVEFLKDEHNDKAFFLTIPFENKRFNKKKNSDFVLRIVVSDNPRDPLFQTRETFLYDGQDAIFKEFLRTLKPLMSNVDDNNYHMYCKSIFIL